MTRVSGTAWRCEQLEVRRYSSPEEMANAAAADVAALLGAIPGVANAMFATGNSQLAFLAALTRRRDISWDRVRVFHMDEYIGLPPEHSAGFGRYIRQRIVDVVHPLEAHYIDGTAEDGQAECLRYASLLQQFPLSLCVMGIGENGHLAFNDPPIARFDDPVDLKVVELDEDCRRQQVGEGHFASLEDVPARAITVTIPALLRAGRVVVVCPEGRKAEPVERALSGPVTTACPASVLRRQANACLYLDADSGARVGPPTC
jgi:glucosamine-6-phosphate deaminase